MPGGVVVLLLVHMPGAAAASLPAELSKWESAAACAFEHSPQILSVRESRYNRCGSC
jgi:hypothetical protein